MTNYEIDEKAKEISDGESAYALGRMVVKLEAERDALSARLQRLTRAGSNLSDRLDDKPGNTAARNAWQAALLEAPTTSLDQHDARVAADAIERVATQISKPEDRSAAMAIVAKYRLQAEEE